MGTNISGKIILIAGSNGLVGKGISEYLTINGALVIDADIANKNQLEENKIYFDICNKASINEAIELITKKHGKIDCLINCAYPRNKNYGRHFFDVEYHDFCENINIHLGGYFLCMQTFAGFFLKQGYGNIINFSSIYGVVPPKFEIYENTKMTVPVEYVAIKSAIIQMSKYLAKYLKNKNIRVNAISIGGVYDKQPEPFLTAYKSKCLNKGMLNVNDVMGTIKFLVSNDSEFINGQNIIIDDGFTL